MYVHRWTATQSITPFYNVKYILLYILHMEEKVFYLSKAVVCIFVTTEYHNLLYLNINVYCKLKCTSAQVRCETENKTAINCVTVWFKFKVRVRLQKVNVSQCKVLCSEVMET